MRPQKLSWRKHSAAEYSSITRHLSPAEYTALGRISDHFWSTGSFPDDDAAFARVAGLSIRQWISAKDAVMEILKGSNNFGGQLEAERENAIRHCQLSACAGKRGGEAKSLKSNNTDVATATILLEKAATDKKIVDTIATDVALVEKKEPSVPKKPPAARGTRLTEDWRPSPEGTAFATAELGGREAAQYEFSKFSEWFRSQPGAKGVKLDWELTWRVWVRTAKGRMRPEPKRVGGFRPTYL